MESLVMAELTQVLGFAWKKVQWLSTEKVEVVPAQHHLPAEEVGISGCGIRPRT